MTAPLRAARAATDWPVVLLVTFAGSSAALQIGKAGAAMPLMRVDLSATLAEAAVYLSVISLLAALTGAAFGPVTARFGSFRVGLCGLLLMSAASAAATLASGSELVFAARIVEALGLPLVVTAMPTLVQGAARPEDRALALGIWAAWLPIGVAVGMALGFVLLEDQGWRTYYLVCSAVPLAVAAALVALRRRLPPSQPASPALPPGPSAGTGPVFRMAAIFCMFSAANLIFMGFLPSVIVESAGLSPRHAMLVALVGALLLVPANVATGEACARGVSRYWLMLIAFLAIGIGGFVFFDPAIPLVVRLVAAVIFALGTGIAPALIWSSIPALSSQSGMPPPVVSGTFYQAAGIGQVAGPVLAGFAVESAATWQAGGWVIVACSIGAVGIALIDRKASGFR
ncbi:MFS transporter [Mesorhizobium sp. 10J20-29]